MLLALTFGVGMINLGGCKSSGEVETETKTEHDNGDHETEVKVKGDVDRR